MLVYNGSRIGTTNNLLKDNKLAVNSTTIDNFDTFLVKG
jgi:hypothetical protein